MTYSRIPGAIYSTDYAVFPATIEIHPDDVVTYYLLIIYNPVAHVRVVDCLALYV